MNKEFWLQKKVFITGHSGFKGNWLTSWLSQLGASITGYSLTSQAQSNLFDQSHLSKISHSIDANILDLNYLKTVLQKTQPEIVFHLAAQPLVHYSYQNPIETYNVNVMGTANLLEAVRQTDSVRAVVIVTSDKCYENREWNWGYRETDPMGGYDPYSSSKGCAELVVSAFRRSYFPNSNFAEHGVAVASVRSGNVIGGGDWAQARIIPDLMRSFFENNMLRLRYPQAYRPWQYVLDVLNGYLLLAESLVNHGSQFADAWNFGPQDENIKTVEWIKEKIISIMGKKIQVDYSESNNLHEATCLKLDSNKTRISLGWMPKMNIESLLEASSAWYQAYFDKQDMALFTAQQIKNYEQLN